MQIVPIAANETFMQFSGYTLLSVVALIVTILLLWRLVWHLRPPRAALFTLIGLWVFPVLVVLPSYGLRIAPPHTNKGSVEIEFWACGVELQSTVLTRQNQELLTSWYQHPLESKKQWTFAAHHASPTLPSLIQSMGGEIQQDSVTLPLSEFPEDWLVPTNLQDGDAQGDITAIELQKYTKKASGGTLASFTTGQTCPGTNTISELQVFVYRSMSDTQYGQQKITNLKDFVLQTSQFTPPADCIIVEFGAPKDRTNKLCPSYGIRDSKRCTAFGANVTDPSVCSLTEVQAQMEGAIE